MKSTTTPARAPRPHVTTVQTRIRRIDDRLTAARACMQLAQLLEEPGHSINTYHAPTMADLARAASAALTDAREEVYWIGNVDAVCAAEAPDDDEADHLRTWQATQTSPAVAK